MEKKIKYDFELKLKFLKFFYLLESCPSPFFPQKSILRGVFFYFYGNIK